MRHFFEASTATELEARVQQLRPDSARQWGTMSVAQMVAHCAGALEQVLGDRKPPRMFAGRLLGWIARPMALGASPMPRNAPTTPDLVIADARELEVERARLLALLDRAAAAGPAGCTTHPHPFFGRLTPQQWSVLVYKHLDHHLRQFGV